MKRNLFLLGLINLSALALSAGVINIGNASYSDAFPGTDKAGRNAFPASTPTLSGNALGRPVPTNDWWSNEVANPHAPGFFNYPLALRSQSDGLDIINNLTGQGITADRPLTIGVEGLTTYNGTTISDYSDWTVTVNWHSDSAGDMDATIGLGMPFVYFTKDSSAPVTVNVVMGNASIRGNILCVSGSYNKASYIIYAPSGSTWNQNGRTFTSTLNGKNYWSAVMLQSGHDAEAFADKLAPFAFVFPGDTRTEWNYDRSTGKVETTYIITPDVKEGDSDKFLCGLLPHHLTNLTGSGPEFVGLEYSTVRGRLAMAACNEFKTSLTFHGILPSLPMISSEAIPVEELKRLTREICEDNGFADWTDSYNDGQLLMRMVQTAEAAKSAGDEEGFRLAFDLVRNQLERWLTYKDGDIDFLFYYHEPWQTMLGYPAGHGQDSNINDHNFHWGYFIRAAAFIAQYDPKWIEGWGDMINLLVRDVASADRNDPMFPYLRAFSPYAGHCWANGTASLSLGNDQESTSEAMQFNTALILWADAINDSDLRDLGVYLYVTELSAIDEYWFDIHRTNLDPGFSSVLASRVFGNAYDDENFWGGGIAGSYGIQIYPVHAGSFYLAHDADYHSRLWNSMTERTKILQNDSNPNIWYDTWLRYLAMTDPREALKLYDSCTHLGEKFGESQAHTLQWITAMLSLGTPDFTLTADHPLAMAFDNNGIITYVGRNNTGSTLPIHFSDGYVLNAEPHSMAYASAGHQKPQIILSVESERFETGEIIDLTADAVLPDDSDDSVKAISFYADDTLIASVNSAPYATQWIPAEAGTFQIKAVLTTTNGESYTSRPQTIKIRRTGEPGMLTCTYSSTEATEGSFVAPYTITCTTKSDAVEITASFEGNYIGFDGPWLFDETNGFREVRMTDAGGGKYTTTLNGIAEGESVRFRVKIAYAGGLGVSSRYTYEAGTYCDNPASGISVINPAESVRCQSIIAFDRWQLTAPAGTFLSVWTIDGRLVDSMKANPDGITNIQADGLQPGIYLLRADSMTGSKTIRLIKK